MLEVILLGVRGSTPAPGPDHVLVGGHTSCLAVPRPDGRYLVLDAGTGLRNLAGVLAGEALRGSIVLTHLHWDHVQGLPFLPNADRPEAEVALHLPAQPPGDATELLSGLMGPPFFPVDPTALRGRWTRSMLEPGLHQLEGLEVTAAAVHHKGGTTYGYRVSDGRHSFAYLPDHAPSTADATHLRRALALAEDVDLLLHGGQFTDDQRTLADAFGHATVGDAVALADAAGARRLVLVHHAPTRTDPEVEALAPDRTPAGCPVQVGRELDRLVVGASRVAVGTAADTTSRPVTMVVSDLKGSTALAERFDAETLRVVLTRYFDVMGAVVAGEGGHVAKIIGDAIVAVFDGSADRAEAARSALRCAVAWRGALEQLNDGFEESWGVRLENRTGVASGWLAADDEATGAVLAGEVVQLAESLEAAAPVGGTLVDQPTLDLVGDDATVEAIGPVARKGLPAGATLAGHLLVAVAGADTGPTAESARSCPTCGVDAGAHARRCPACGTVLAAADLAESRRTVTVLFADPRPIHAAGRPLQPPEQHRAMSRYEEVVRPVVEGHGGTVERFIGDALMAVFGLPVRHEDDPQRAVRAALDVQVAVGRLGEELDADGLPVHFANPIGVNTGTVVAGDTSSGQRLVTGDAVNVAARLEQAAGPGEVILGPLTRRLCGDEVEVVDLEPLALKGKSEPLPAYRVAAIRRAAADHHHRLPLIGRDHELAAMVAELDAAIAAGAARRFTLIGDAGVGKSRVTQELVAAAGARMAVLQGGCLAYGDGITFWPLLRVVQAAAAIAETDDAATARLALAELVDHDPELISRLGSVAGLVDTSHPVPELVWALRALLERLGGDRPLLVVVDDVHWAEPTLLEVVDELARTVRAPVVFACTARPTVHETHPDFVAGAPVVELGPLTDEACERFLELLLGGEAVDRASIARLVEASAGNPLFLEQLLSMLVDDGRLRRSGDGWRLRGDLATLEVPATVEGLLAARLDRLPAAERQAIGPASVIGRHFAVEALRHLLADDLPGPVEPLLVELERRDLVLPEPDEDPAYRFQHQLVRDATYAGLLKQARAVLHERFVAWAGARNAERDRDLEFDEILGYHLEQAFRCWREIGPLDDHARQLGAAAAARLGGAGARALARGDVHAAANLLHRAADLLSDDHEDRPAVLLRAGAALHEVGEFDRAIEAYEASRAAAERVGRIGEAVAAETEGLRLRYLAGRLEEGADVGAEVERLLARLTDLDDPDALSRVWQLRLNTQIEACRWATAQEAAETVVREARRAGNDVLAVRTLPLLAFLAQKGPMPVAQARAACEAILVAVAGDRRSSSLAQLELAMTDAMSGDVASARARCSSTRAALVDLGWEMQAALVSLSSGPIELLADEPARAEAELARDLDALERMDERNFISLTMVLLAEARYRLRRFDEATDLVARSREIAWPDDVAVQTYLATVGAKLDARRGDVAAGLEQVAAGVALMEATDDPSGLGDVLLDRAEVRWLAGDPQGAADDAAAALAAYERKGNELGATRARRSAQRLADGQDPLP